MMSTGLFDEETEGGPGLVGAFTEGDPAWRVLLGTGENASGKSPVRRLISAICQRQKKVEHIVTSLEAKTHHSDAPWLAMVYGSEAWSATGQNSAHLILGGIRTARGRETPHVLTWDEPELGLSEGAQLAAGEAFADLGRAPGAHTRVMALVTHSRHIGRALLPLRPPWRTGSRPRSSPAPWRTSRAPATRASAGSRRS
jgi:hypothetical protein